MRATKALNAHDTSLTNNKLSICAIVEAFCAFATCQHDMFMFLAPLQKVARFVSCLLISLIVKATAIYAFVEAYLQYIVICDRTDSVPCMIV
jgi:hypothetical protein